MLTTLPEPRALGSVPSLRWGIAAPGDIAAKFTAAVQRHSSQHVVAVGSRSLERAQDFATRFDIGTAHGSYDALVDDSQVDVVYIAAPHNVHAELALLAIAAGKHVLIEKPFTATAFEARTVAEAARAAGIFAMEGMWTRYLPQSDIVRQLLEQQVIGEVTAVTAEFGFSLPFDPSHRLYDPARAGGVLLDAGIYPLSFASSVLGRPRNVSAVGTLAPSGVEDQAVISVDYGSAQAALLTSTRAALPGHATIVGTEGSIVIDPPFIAAGGLSLRQQRTWRRVDDPLIWRDRTFQVIHDAMSYQADTLASYVGEGRIESPVHPLDEVVSVLEVIDSARAQLGSIGASEDGRRRLMR